MLTDVFSSAHCFTCCFLARFSTCCAWSAGCYTSTTATPAPLSPLRALRVELVGSRDVAVALACDVAMPLIVRTWRGPDCGCHRVSCCASASAWPSRQTYGVVSTREVPSERSRLAAVSAALGCVPRGQGALLDADTHVLIHRALPCLCCPAASTSGTESTVASRDCPSARPCRKVLSELLCRRRP